LGSFFLDPEDVRSISLGAIWNFNKGTGLLRLGHQIMGQKGPVQRAGASGLKGSNLLTIHFYSQAMEVYGGLYVKIHGFIISTTVM
jgi:hypothetical protein